MPACSPPRSAWIRATASAYVTSGLPRSGRLGGEEGENAAERVLEVAPLDDHVELSVREQELRALEAFGERLADRLGYDPRPGEADQRAWLGHDDVAEHREARGAASGRGLLGGGPHALAVFLRVLEGQRIGRRETGFALLERAGVGELADALAGGDAERVVTLRAHAPAALHLGSVDDLLAGVALDPQP